MNIKFWQGFLMAAFFVAFTGILYEFTEMQEENAYNKGRSDAQQEQLEYLKGKDKY